jgi:hypothetical protein
MNIREDSNLSKVSINMLSRKIDLYGDDGEHVQIAESNGDDFTSMCKFVNETLTKEVQEVFKVNVEYVF